jgi:hypothetical protein
VKAILFPAVYRNGYMIFVFVYDSYTGKTSNGYRLDDLLRISPPEIYFAFAYGIINEVLSLVLIVNFAHSFAIINPPT